MRERHFPRLCRSCEAPMARQEDACWRCGALWVSEEAPRTTLHVIAGGAPAHRDPRITVVADARAASEARLDAEADAGHRAATGSR